MTLSQKIKSNRFLFSLALKWKEKHSRHETLPDEEKKIVESLESNGVAILEDFFTEEECQSFNEHFDHLDSRYIRKYDNDSRVYGIEKLDKAYEDFHNSDFFKKIGESYVGEELIIQTTMAAKITYDKEIKHGSGGGWHRDSFAKQYKAIAYTQDCHASNGPFQYLQGSHKLEKVIDLIRRRDGAVAANYPRYMDEEVKAFMSLHNYKLLTAVAKKGTVILVDTRGIHRGSPIKQGERRAIFNYYVGKSYYNKNNSIERLSEY